MANPGVKQKASNGTVVKAKVKDMPKKRVSGNGSSVKAKSKVEIQPATYNTRAKGEVKKTLKAIEQAKQIQQGKKPAKSFEQAIREL